MTISKVQPETVTLYWMNVQIQFSTAIQSRENRGFEKARYFITEDTNVTEGRVYFYSMEHNENWCGVIVKVLIPSMKWYCLVPFFFSVKDWKTGSVELVLVSRAFSAFSSA